VISKIIILGVGEKCDDEEAVQRLGGRRTSWGEDPDVRAVNPASDSEHGLAFSTQSC
jgi:hypothetical protein